MPEVNISYCGKSLKFDHIPSEEELKEALKKEMES
jgi:hypothetical protein